MEIKELRDNIDKIDDVNLENLLYDMCEHCYNVGYTDGYNEDIGEKNIGFKGALNIDITDYMPIPYSVVESEKTDED